ncbi:MAG: esterase/lipase family protein [Gammaproteobacteria bacterium]
MAGQGMRAWFRAAASVLALVSATPALADVLVLVHGFASHPATWQQSGVVQGLARHGWSAASVGGERTLYLAHLTSEAPLAVQANQLNAQLAAIRQAHPDDPKLVVVGHSAGGVVARMALVQGNPHGVSRLVTIASPHLGSPRAAEGLDVLDSKPFFCPGPGISMLKSFFGGSDYDYLDRARPAMVDLLPAGSGNALDWLNGQPHPDIRYDAVLRQSRGGVGDAWVPAHSQDMNQVPALRGRATVWLSQGDHWLNPADAEVIGRILH